MASQGVSRGTAILAVLHGQDARATIGQNEKGREPRIWVKKTVAAHMSRPETYSRTLCSRGGRDSYRNYSKGTASVHPPREG